MAQPVKNWNLDDVVQWANDIGIDNEDSIKLKIHKINGEALLKMSFEKLIYCGIPVGTATNLVDAISNLKNQDYIPPPKESIPLKDIKGDMKDIVYILSGVELHEPSIVTLIEPSKFLRALPAQIGSSNIVDLRLIDGNLGQPNKRSNVVEKLLKKFEDSKKLPFCNPQLLLSGSGVGKTKALLDLLKETYGIFIDCTFGHEGKDIVEMYQYIDSHVLKEKYPYKKCEYEVLLTVASRAIALVLYVLSGKIKEPRQWLFTQMNGLTTHYYVNSLFIIRRYLRNYVPLEKVFIFYYIFTECKNFFGQRLLIVIDESNVLLRKHVDTFPSSSNSSKNSRCRPLFSLVTSSLVIITDSILIVAGTKLEMKDKELWDSLLAKVGASAGCTPEVIYDLPLMTNNDGKILINALFKEEYKKQAYEIFFKYIPGPGRYRYLTTWVESYVVRSDNLETSLLLFNKELFYSDYIWTIRSMIESFVDLQGKQRSHKLFCELVIAYVYYDGRLKSMETVEWMAGGFCRVNRDDSSFYYEIKEPLIIRGVLNYIREHQVSLSSYFMTKIIEADNAANAGTILDNLVALCIEELTGKNIPSLKDLNLEPLKINSLIRLNDPTSLVKTKLIDVLKSDSIYILPKHYAGPDGMLLCGKVLYIIGIKTTQRLGRNVDTRDVESNFDITDLCNLFGNRMDKDDEKTDIWKYLAKIKLSHVIRIHIVLPGASKNAKIFKIGLRKERDILSYTPNTHSNSNKRKRNDVLNLKATEWILDINNSNLSSCGIFSDSISSSLLEIYQIKH